MHEFPIPNISRPIDGGMATGGTLTTERFLFNFVEWDVFMSHPCLYGEHRPSQRLLSLESG
nr:hypothetical protein I308_04970 [Cryptococcus tetragattii IND107]